MKHPTVNITADGNYRISPIDTSPNMELLGHALLGGDFGGGSVSFSVTLDGGVTLYPLTDLTGSQPTFTASQAVPISNLGDPEVGGVYELYATLSGATSPDLNITVVDNQ